MMYVVSIVLMVALIMGGILLAASPDIFNVVTRDFVRKTNQNAKLYSLQWVDLALRVRDIDPADPDPDKRNATLAMDWVERTDDVAVKNITCNVVTVESPKGALINVTVVNSD